MGVWLPSTDCWYGVGVKDDIGDETGVKNDIDDETGVKDEIVRSFVKGMTLMMEMMIGIILVMRLVPLGWYC